MDMQLRPKESNASHSLPARGTEASALEGASGGPGASSSTSEMSDALPTGPPEALESRLSREVLGLGRGRDSEEEERLPVWLRVCAWFLPRGGASLATRDAGVGSHVEESPRLPLLLPTDLTSRTTVGVWKRAWGSGRGFETDRKCRMVPLVEAEFRHSDMRWGWFSEAALRLTVV
jgi:hypothetical protein